VKQIGETRHTGLARALSKLGYCSRSQAAALIRAGRVRLNGRERCDPETPVVLDRDRIQVDGTAIAAEKSIYLMMNKPRGIVTTASDEKGRDTVYKILGQADSRDGNDIAKNLRWVAPVGRLDKASEGLLLLTNDSEWAAQVTAPETHLDKTYHVQIAALADAKMLESLERGVRTEEGETLRAKRVSLLRSGEKNCWLQIVLDEGKNRQIRRMLTALDVEVLRLIRTAIGPLELGNLAKGTFRPLTKKEKVAVDRVMTGNLA
jgi:23S rRNA pseudouridine2605 synthase